MSAVAAELYAVEKTVGRQSRYQLPCAVERSVVNKYNAAVNRYFSFLDKLRKISFDFFGGNAKYRFLVLAVVYYP